jgi:hypothetical protein
MADAMRVTYSVVPAPCVRAIVRGLVTSALASMLNASGLPALSRIGPRSAGSGISVSSCRADAAFRSGAWNDWMTTSLRVAMPSTATSSTRPTRSRLLAVAAGLRRGGAGRRCAGTAIAAPADAVGQWSSARSRAAQLPRVATLTRRGRGPRGGGHRAIRAAGAVVRARCGWAGAGGGHRAVRAAGAEVARGCGWPGVATVHRGGPPRSGRW